MSKRTPTQDRFPLVTLDDGEPATRTELFFFWAVLLGAVGIWCAMLLRIGYWLAVWPPSAQSSADFMTGILLGISAGILLVASLYRPVSRADRARDAATRSAPR